MYNQQFLDVMDKVNSIAKTLGFTNGVTWARKQLENARMNEYTFEFCSSCHDLRNLMAHGYAMDINISAATLQKAQMFLKAISNPYANHNAMFLNTNSHINPNMHLEVQVGDYVIIMAKNTTTVRGYANYFRIETGYLCRVVEVNQRSVILENLNNKAMYDIDRLRAATAFNLEDGLYVFKNNPLGFNINSNMQINILNRPNLDQGMKGSPFITFEYTTDSILSGWGQQCYYNDLDIRKVTVKGYLAHIDCFDKSKTKPLLDFTSGNIDEYLGKKEPSHFDYYQDDDGLPF